MVGKDVSFALLQAIAELPDEALRAGLDRLRTAEFLDETGLFADLAYAFKHALTHEVAYSGLLQERRRELHARIVDAIETLQRDRLGEQTERLAHHAVRGELREKAVHYLRQAGVRAAARSALHDARDWLEQALAVLEWMESYVKRDTAFLERYVSDDYTSIDPHGTVVDKKGEIEPVKSGHLAITEMNPNEMKVRTYGDAAVVTGRSTIKAKIRGQDASGEYRFTDVRVRRGDRWQAVASQLTRIARP